MTKFKLFGPHKLVFLSRFVLLNIDTEELSVVTVDKLTDKTKVSLLIGDM